MRRYAPAASTCSFITDQAFRMPVELRLFDNQAARRPGGPKENIIIGGSSSTEAAANSPNLFR